MEKIAVKAYLDANVFIYAAIGNENIKPVAIELFSFLKENKFKAISNLLTFDEIIKVIASADKDKAMEVGQGFLSMEDIERVAFTESIAYVALYNLRKYNLSPRDSIHLATAQTSNVDAIVSEDKDFSKIKEIPVYRIQKFVEMLSKGYLFGSLKGKAKRFTTKERHDIWGEKS